MALYIILVSARGLGICLLGFCCDLASDYVGV